MKKWSLLLLLALILMACNWTLYAPRPVGRSAPTPAPTEGALRLTATPSPTPRAVGTSVSAGNNKQAKVCTGYPQGALNVRMCPGVGCWAFFPLSEGQVVAMDGQTDITEDGATWVHLTQPVDGWVNGKYLCETAK